MIGGGYRTKPLIYPGLQPNVCWLSANALVLRIRGLGKNVVEVLAVK
jgi:hypothetical protein